MGCIWAKAAWSMLRGNRSIAGFRTSARSEPVCLRFPALVQSFRVQRGEQPIGNFMTPPDAAIPPEFQRRARNPVQTWSLNAEHKRLHRFFELGTVYTMIAGLLNILVIYDAWGGPAYAEQGRASPREPTETSRSKNSKTKG